MIGPYKLNLDNIDQLIRAERPGNYMLGGLSNNKFVPCYVGRSETNLNERLKDWVGKYNYFVFCLSPSIQDAFYKECHNYHLNIKLFKLDNDVHPVRPDSKDWKCPICNIYK